MDTTVAKAFLVLEVLARSRRPMRLAAITEAVGLHKSNVHRLLSTLVELGYVERDPETTRYAATLKAWEIGVSIITANGLRRAVSPHLHKLHVLTGDTALLVAPVGDEVLFLDRVATARLLRYTPMNGTRAPMIITASGRAFLSRMADARPVIERGLTASPDTGLSVEQLMAEVASARRQGYAVSAALTPGALAVAAVLPGPGGVPAAAITISGPQRLMQGDHLETVVEHLLDTCAEIGEVGAG
ncbi:IclR family transcriptional regulator [Phenylobacterium sp.]|uniref:IclR family transcriptional regulator n=1 Tax=Phenylobacterium sp. TaxID=1871053 RepID=UPI002731AB18|nr:IclR family transcriptional regulator [Phenylobacterium sp.]MDP1617964.1 IclR family transcriptional regulator [Phenylobacterium sp.]MDP1988817.1 IclR family transcriptional regulator [Phenylobacterium sp.]